jgi:hypothetical protein
MAIISSLIAVAFLIYLVLRIVGMIGGYRTNRYVANDPNTGNTAAV